MGTRQIDLESWPRRHLYAFYRKMDDPYLAVTVEVDLTPLVRRCRADGHSLFAVALHQLCLAANAVPVLRTRIRGETVVAHDQVDPAFTVGVEGGLFNFTTVPLTSDAVAFARAVAAVSAEMRANPELAPFDGLRDDVLYMSCLPWLRFTHLSHPTSPSRGDSVPRIAWGKLVEVDGSWRCPVNILAHHALVDGQHLGAFFRALEAGVAAL